MLINILLVIGVVISHVVCLLIGYHFYIFSLVQKSSNATIKSSDDSRLFSANEQPHSWDLDAEDIDHIKDREEFDEKTDRKD